MNHRSVRLHGLRKIVFTQVREVHKSANNCTVPAQALRDTQSDGQAFAKSNGSMADIQYAT